MYAYRICVSDHVLLLLTVKIKNTQTINFAAFVWEISQRQNIDIITIVSQTCRWDVGDVS